MNNRERRHARSQRVDRLIGLIEEIQHGKYIGRNEVISRQLFPKEYGELLVQVDERDRDFQSFFYYDNVLGTSIENLSTGRSSSGSLCFIYQEDHYTHPPLIFEIAWSQSTHNLEARAIELIEEGAGQIRTVVGLDFYETWRIWGTIRDEVGNSLDPKRGPFTAFVWRVAFDRSGQQIFNANNRPRIQKSKFVFCDNEGIANPAETLQLKLRDFVPERVIKAEGWAKVKDMDDAKLELDASTMLQYFDDALKRQKLKDENSELKRQKSEEEKRRAEAERAARRGANAEKEHRRWGISGLIKIGGHGLRRLPGRD